MRKKSQEAKLVVQADSCDCVISHQWAPLFFLSLATLLHLGSGWDGVTSVPTESINKQF